MDYSSTQDDSSQITIRAASTLLDWENARGLVREYFQWVLTNFGREVASTQPHPGLELLRLPGIYAPPVGNVFVGYLVDEPVGVAAVRLLAPEVAEMKRVYVTPAGRGFGIATQLVDATIAEAGRLGARRMVLQSHSEEMKTAVELYRRRGFREVADYNDLSRRVSGAISMELTLVDDVALPWPSAWKLRPTRYAALIR